MDKNMLLLFEENDALATLNYEGCASPKDLDTYFKENYFEHEIVILDYDTEEIYIDLHTPLVVLDDAYQEWNLNK